MKVFFRTSKIQAFFTSYGPCEIPSQNPRKLMSHTNSIRTGLKSMPRRTTDPLLQCPKNSNEIKQLPTKRPRNQIPCLKIIKIQATLRNNDNIRTILIIEFPSPTKWRIRREDREKGGEEV
uniref:Uncharacterized protein n=1 Tax=Opuntia streptacantha TaxID=393608 RepID=A0A7C8YTM8_OPUST